MLHKVVLQINSLATLVKWKMPLTIYNENYFINSNNGRIDNCA